MDQSIHYHGDWDGGTFLIVLLHVYVVVALLGVPICPSLLVTVSYLLSERLLACLLNCINLACRGDVLRGLVVVFYLRDTIRLLQILQTCPLETPESIGWSKAASHFLLFYFLN